MITDKQMEDIGLELGDRLRVHRVVEEEIRNVVPTKQGNKSYRLSGPSV